MAEKKKTKGGSRRRKGKYTRKALARRKRILVLTGILAGFLLCVLCVALIFLHRMAMIGISDEVMAYRPQVEQYAREAGIPEYVDYLLAIMQVETGGKEKDVMQSSESLGLPRNTLDTEESIKQGCLYLAENLARAKELGCDELSAVQAYNFGIDYLDFIAERGGIQSIEIAEEFAKIKSGGKTTRYLDEIAIKYNGGYRYKFGNMYYAEIVRRLMNN